jgi:hypothetical protein
MRDITEMATVLTNKLEQKLEKLKEAQRETAKVIWEDTVNEAPVTEANYISSIQVSDTKEEKDVIKTSVFSDLLVGGDIPKWQNVPLAAFMEWGTGPLGESTNSYDHGYSYTTDAPWNFIAQMQYELTGTWGMEARPHFYPALQKNVALYKENIRKALKEE